MFISFIRRPPTSSRKLFITTMATRKLRIGIIPEHFSTPLHFASKHFALNADLINEPLGTGALTARLKLPADSPEALDIAVGLTEGFVSDLGKNKLAGKQSGYGLVGTYVESPLCWAIVTGAGRQDVKGLDGLKGRKVGVSRLLSGSHVMSFVLADQHDWLDSTGEGNPPFDAQIIGDFAALRAAVNDGRADMFMWEHFTTKHYWDNGELKRLGEIYTPWPSWMIAARETVDEGALAEVFQKVNDGVRYYQQDTEDAIDHITSTMKYSREDAQAWMKTVRFAVDVRGVASSVVDKTVEILRKAGVLTEAAGGSKHMITLKR